jgi:hypothetical protein
MAGLAESEYIYLQNGQDYALCRWKLLSNNALIIKPFFVPAALSSDQ